MGKRKRIKELEAEVQRERDDYQHTHDTMWSLLALLCEEFGLTLNAVPMVLDNKSELVNLDAVMTALMRADALVVGSPGYDYAMDDVWDMVDAYRSAHG
jgi:hypothetical protein